MIKTSLLLVTFFALIFINYQWQQQPVDTAAIIDTRPVSLLKNETNSETFSLEEISIADVELVHTYSRPLFNEDRRKFVAPKKVQKKVVISKPIEVKQEEEVIEVADPPRIKLLGVSILPQKSSALILNQDTNEMVWVRLNTQVQDWELASIEAGKIILSNAGEQIEIELYNSRSNEGDDQ